jgi:ABC-2 type transport system ATP-binding protein
MERAAMIELKDVRKSYAGKPALDEVSLQLPQGEIVGLLGENGAGKTTLMKCILGFLPYRGSITLDGAPITPANIARISFATCEHSFFPGLSPKGHREFYAAHFPRFSQQRFQGLMEFFSLPMNKPLRGFSTGQQNQFEVIMALCQGADYILMDEPFAGNDIFNREDFYKVLLGILEPHETVVLSTHLIEEVAPFLSRAVLLRQGRIAGDVRLSDLEEEGQDLISYIKQTYHYRPDRVSRALDHLTGEGDAP